MCHIIGVICKLPLFLVLNKHSNRNKKFSLNIDLFLLHDKKYYINFLTGQKSTEVSRRLKIKRYYVTFSQVKSSQAKNSLKFPESSSIVWVMMWTINDLWVSGKFFLWHESFSWVIAWAINSFLELHIMPLSVFPSRLY